MLLKCPECELQVSDKALTCPHCGYPMKPEGAKPRKPRNKNHKRKRLPNGFGQITEIKGRNLRNPFRVMVTVGKYPNGKPICKPLKPKAYFPTYNDAYAALVEYNKNPYDLSDAITVEELYDRWSQEYFQTISNPNETKNAWKYCSSVYKMRVIDLRVRHIKGCMENGVAVIRGEKKTPTAIVKNRIKTLFNLMLDYALEYELVKKNYSRDFKLSEDTIKDLNTVKKEHIPFSDDEMEILWSHVNDIPYVDILLIQCYSGWRPQELGLIELKNVNLKEMLIKGGMKTESGKERIVPIHSRIKHLVEQKYNEALDLKSDYLFNYIDPERKYKKTNLTYNRYQTAFSKICCELNLNPQHRPHDGRKHFATNAKKYGVDEYALKYMIGHKITDITESVYTKRENDWLKEEIEKIK